MVNEDEFYTELFFQPLAILAYKFCNYSVITKEDKTVKDYNRRRIMFRDQSAFHKDSSI